MPELYHRVPVFARVFLDRDPFGLVVTRKHEIVLELRADESPVIVARRIHEMADDLLRGPFTRSVWLACTLGWNSRETLRRLIDGIPQITSDVLHR